MRIIYAIRSPPHAQQTPMFNRSKAIHSFTQHKKSKSRRSSRTRSSSRIRTMTVAVVVPINVGSFYGFLLSLITKLVINREAVVVTAACDLCVVVYLMSLTAFMFTSVYTHSTGTHAPAICQHPAEITKQQKEGIQILQRKRA